MEQTKSCPCHYTNPCHPFCSCVNPHMSRGCERCCSSGSIEQRRARALMIAEAVFRYKEANGPTV